jgi:hypothetical protein
VSEKKKTANSSELWNSYHQVFVNNVLQEFVLCNSCKSLLAYSSKNVVTGKRTRFGAQKINQLLFLQKNLSLLQELRHDELAKRKRTLSVSCEQLTDLLPKKTKSEEEKLNSNVDENEEEI